MKKTLLTIFAGVLAISFASAQCNPDPAYATASGNFFPDSVTFVTDQAASAGVDYAATIDIKTIVDTAVSAGGFDATVIIDAFKIHQVNGAPAGFTFTGGGSTFEQPDPRADFNDVPDSTWWNNYGSVGDVNTLSTVQGCISITASAATITGLAPETGFTDYPIEVLVDARIANAPGVEFLVSNGTWLRDEPVGQGPLPVNGYVLRVYAEDENPNSVADFLNLNAFNVAQSFPNPATETATISYTTPNSTKIDFKVYNMLGGLVYSEAMTSQKGMNNIQLETSAMTAGMYVYTVSNGVKVHTKRMNIN
jgi:hypothetical protein